MDTASGIHRKRRPSPRSEPDASADATGCNGETRPIGPRMVAYYACLYYAALRPEEAAGIIVPGNLVLPPSDGEWGEFVLDTAEPHAGKA
jgi:hypothetical protein